MCKGLIPLKPGEISAGRFQMWKTCQVGQAKPARFFALPPKCHFVSISLSGEKCCSSTDQASQAIIYQYNEKNLARWNLAGKKPDQSIFLDSPDFTSGQYFPPGRPWSGRFFALPLNWLAKFGRIGFTRGWSGLDQGICLASGISPLKQEKRVQHSHGQT